MTPEVTAIGFAYFVLSCLLLGSVSCSDSPADPPAATDRGMTDVVDVAADLPVDVGPDPEVEDIGTEEVDLPPEEPTGTINDGEACVEDSECIGGHCFLHQDGFPEGMCSPNPCGPEVTCTGPNTVCFVPSEGGPFCSRRCSSHGECRSQYDCEFIQDLGWGACVPGPPATDLPDSEPCTEDEQCRGGTCLRAPQYPGGHCTTLRCEAAEDCSIDAGEAGCLVAQGGGTNFCVRPCETSDNCRSRYVCTPIADSEESYCAPDPNQPVVVDTDSSPLGFDCGSVQVSDTTQRISYSVAETSTSYMIVPVALDGRRMLPDRIRVPGDAVDINIATGGNAGQALTSLLLGFTSPMVFPWLPTHTDQLHAGSHELDIQTSSEELCHYYLEESSDGSVLDFNVYLVGVPDLRAEIAAADLNLAAVFEGVGAILATAGINVGEVRYYDLDAGVVERYGIIRADTEVFELVAHSSPPGDTLDDHLSVNVFITEDFQLNGPIGVSTGLPGPAGLHGTTGSGVVITGAVLGQGEPGNTLTAMTLAHEVGHYLGLWHTSEIGGIRFDPLDDTPQCDNEDFSDCPDETNLMFPIAGVDHNILSDGQVFILQRNPLSKE